MRLAFRVLSRTPLVTLVAAASLALGIGATTAIFSLSEQILLRPLPVAEPGRLVNLSSPGPRQGWVSSDAAGPGDDVFSHPMFRDLQHAQTVFRGLAAHRLFEANLAWRGRTENAEGLLVSGSYFGVLGLRPALGRLMGPEDDRVAGAHDVVVLGHDYWRSRFGAAPDVIGQTLLIRGRAMTIAGVAPRGFRSSTLGSVPSVYVPMRMREALLGEEDVLDDRLSHWAYLFARLAPGTSRERAESALGVTYRALLDEVEAPLQSGMSGRTLERFRARRLLLSDGARGQSWIHRDARPPLLLLLGATGFVLLIAPCAPEPGGRRSRRWSSISATRACTSGSWGSSPASTRRRRRASWHSSGRTQSSPLGGRVALVEDQVEDLQHRGDAGPPPRAPRHRELRRRLRQTLSRYY